MSAEAIVITRPGRQKKPGYATAYGWYFLGVLTSRQLRAVSYSCPVERTCRYVTRGIFNTGVTTHNVSEVNFHLTPTPTTHALNCSQIMKLLTK
jgi:hypothetical protein